MEEKHRRFIGGAFLLEFEVEDYDNAMGFIGGIAGGIADQAALIPAVFVGDGQRHVAVVAVLYGTGVAGGVVVLPSVSIRPMATTSVR